MQGLSFRASSFIKLSLDYLGEKSIFPPQRKNFLSLSHQLGELVILAMTGLSHLRHSALDLSCVIQGATGTRGAMLYHKHKIS